MSIQQADERAQMAFRAVLGRYDVTGQWDPTLADEYHNAERDLDWEQSKAEMDRLLTEDHDYHRTTGRRVSGCAHCATPVRVYEGCE